MYKTDQNDYPVTRRETNRRLLQNQVDATKAHFDHQDDCLTCRLAQTMAQVAQEMLDRGDLDAEDTFLRFGTECQRRMLEVFRSNSN